MGGVSRQNHDLTARATGDALKSLTDRERAFVDFLMQGQKQTMAARSAGYAVPHVSATNIIRRPHVQAALAYLQKKHEKSANMTRKRVMDGFLEAIEMAKLQADSATMVNGWREIARMCGYYAPEKKLIEVNTNSKRTVDRLETLSDEELLEMIEKDEDVIEGEFSEVLETMQRESDSDDRAD